MTDRPGTTATDQPDGAPVLEIEPDPAPGGWRRVILALLVGVAVGALVALVLPRERAEQGREGAHQDPGAATRGLVPGEDGRDDDGTDR